MTPGLAPQTPTPLSQAHIARVQRTRRKKLHTHIPATLSAHALIKHPLELLTRTTVPGCLALRESWNESANSTRPPGRDQKTEHQKTNPPSNRQNQVNKTPGPLAPNTKRNAQETPLPTKHGPKNLPLHGQLNHQTHRKILRPWKQRRKHTC